MSNRLCAITYWKICKDNPIKQVKYAPFCALTGAGVCKLLEPIRCNAKPTGGSGKIHTVHNLKTRFSFCCVLMQFTHLTAWLG